tara:strand:- start:1047 stop:1601 length:555 start_codon:yes stop_codon:yes gene_type:complete
MLSGNMRVLARVAGGGSSVNFNSSNMNGCTVFCIQYTYYAGGSITGGTQNCYVSLNGEAGSGSDYKSGHHVFNYDAQSSVVGASATNLWWNVNENNSFYILAAATGQPDASDGVSGELWVKSNKRDSSWAMIYNRLINWGNQNKLNSLSSVCATSAVTGQITSIEFTASSGVMIMLATLWGGAD